MDFDSINIPSIRNDIDDDIYKVIVFNVHPSFGFSQDYLEMKSVLEKNHISFTVGDSNHEDYILIERHLKEGEPVVFMTPEFYIVGLDKLKANINKIKRYAISGEEPGDIDDEEEIGMYSSQIKEEPVQESGLMNGLFANVIGIAKSLNPLSHIREKSYVDDNVKGDRMQVFIKNELGVMYHRTLIFTEKFIIRMNPDSKERRSIRPYSDVVKIVINKKDINIHYVDNKVDYYNTRESTIESIIGKIVMHNQLVVIRRL